MSLTNPPTGGADGALPPPGSVTQIGRYKVEKELGRGAMGVVYLGVDAKIQRKVALKVLHAVAGVSDTDLEEFRSRFYREARTAGMLSHPNIVVIHDVDSDETLGITFMAMEFLNGQPLNDLLRSGFVLTREQSIDICIQVAEGLDHAHRQNIVHRDIKPGNLMLLEDGTIKITDFGIAKIQTSNLTRTGQFLGTPNYMSPEQVIGHVIDGRSDLFSLGIILYELLTGEKPFMGSSLTTITYQIVNVDPIEPSKIRPGIPKAFDVIVSRLLAKSPDDRYQTGKEVADALRAIKLGGTPSATATLAGTGAGGGAQRPVSSNDVTQIGGPGAAATNVPTSLTNVAGRPGEPAAAGGSKKGLLIGVLAAVVVLVAAGLVFALTRDSGPAEPPVALNAPLKDPLNAPPTTTAAPPVTGAATTVPTDAATSGGTPAVVPAGTGSEAGNSAPPVPVPSATPASTPEAIAIPPARTRPEAPTASLPPPRIVAPAAITLPPRRNAPVAATAAAAQMKGTTSVNLIVEHDLKSGGTVTVLLDDKEMARATLTVDKKKGGVSQISFDVPDGAYTVKVCLDSTDIEGIDRCPQRRHTFVMNTTATIRARHQKVMAAPHKFYYTIE